MKRYKLLKDLPTFKAGSEFDYDKINGLTYTDGVGLHHIYTAAELEDYPNILTDWFEEIPKKPRAVDDIQIGDKYYYVSSYLTPMQDVWGNIAFDRIRREVGNCYLTEEEAEREAKWLEARAILKRDTKGFEPNWRDDMMSKWYVEYDAYMEEFDAYATAYASASGSLYFASEQDAQSSFKAHPNEWKTYLGVE